MISTIVYSRKLFQCYRTNTLLLFVDNNKTLFQQKKSMKKLPRYIFNKNAQDPLLLNYIIAIILDNCFNLFFILFLFTSSKK